jgi:putative flippase GtrA
MAALLRRPLVRKLFRYSVASLSGAFVGVGSLALFDAGFHWPAVAANLASVTLGTIPNYLVNRYWTWQRAGRERMTLEATVFWLIALLGLVVSTVFVAFADRRWGTTIALIAAQLSGFGLLWVGRFIFLDKVLYRVAEVIEEHVEEHEHHEHAHPEDVHGQA